MDQNIKAEIAASIKDFKLPDYESIPDVGLYLEQTVRYVADYLAPFPTFSITSSMVSNYVKKGLIANPVKKLYHREQIAYIFFIAVAKTMLSMEDIQLLIRLQKNSYATKIAYEYFCREFINILNFVFGLKDHLDEVGKDDTEEKNLFRNTIIAVSHKLYLDKYMDTLHETLE